MNDVLWILFQKKIFFIHISLIQVKLYLIDTDMFEALIGTTIQLQRLTKVVD
jgi:hypothetical protein